MTEHATCRNCGHPIRRELDMPWVHDDDRRECWNPVYAEPEQS